MQKEYNNVRVQFEIFYILSCFYDETNMYNHDNIKYVFISRYLSCIGQLMII